MYLLVIAILSIVYGLQLLWVLFASPRSELFSSSSPILVVLGSGGHTSEMLRWLQIAKPTKKIVFVVSETDNHSSEAAKKFDPKAEIILIPRAREVGQSYITSIFTTLKAIFSSFSVVLKVNPRAIIVNGPGVCIPIVVADIIITTLSNWNVRRAALLNIESFACVNHLSLSGKILIFLAHTFVVQWPELLTLCKRKFPKKLIENSLVYSGPFNISSENQEDANTNTSSSSSLSSVEATNAGIEILKQQLPNNNNTSDNNNKYFRPILHSANNKNNNSSSSNQQQQQKQIFDKPTCVVTVGSTKFDELIQVVNTMEFEQEIKKLGIEHLLIQKGASDVNLTSTTTSSSLTKTVVDYKHGLGADIAAASLVISHAGAGTILEACAAKVPTVVVPNSRLMSNHQLELASGLACRGHLLCAEPERLIDLLKRNDINWQGFVSLPPPNADSFLKVARKYFH